MQDEKTDKLPLEPSLTPAMGVGGFILIALGAVLAGIGSRHLRYFSSFPNFTFIILLTKSQTAFRFS